MITACSSSLLSVLIFNITTERFPELAKKVMRNILSLSCGPVCRRARHHGSLVGPVPTRLHTGPSWFTFRMSDYVIDVTCLQTSLKVITLHQSCSVNVLQVMSARCDETSNSDTFDMAYLSKISKLLCRLFQKFHNNNS